MAEAKNALEIITNTTQILLNILKMAALSKSHAQPKAKTGNCSIK